MEDHDGFLDGSEGIESPREYLKNAIESVPVGILILSEELRILSANACFRKMIGRPDAEFRGRSLTEALSIKELPAMISEVRETGLSQTREVVDAGEKHFRMTATSVRYTKEDPARLLLMVEETTERKKEEVLMHRILNAAQEGVVVADDQGTITWVNPATERMFGSSNEKLIGQPLVSIMPERYRGKHQEAFTAFLASGTSTRFGKPLRMEGLRSNGEVEFPLEVILSAFKQADRWTFTAFFRDRTEEAMAEGAMLKAYEGLKTAQAHLLQSEKMASIGQLAAGVAHEINNPVGFVKSNLGTLREYAEDLSLLVGEYETLLAGVARGDSGTVSAEVNRVRELAQKIDAGWILADLSKLVTESLDGVERVRQIVQNLKEFSHVDEEERKPFDLNQGIESTLKIVWNEVKYKAEVVKEFGDLPELLCYPGQLNQVFMNVLVNAGQAIKERGKIWIRTFTRDGQIVVEVEDTGCGIPEENLKKIFDPFFTTKPVGKGTGLGLSVSYGIIRKHQGRIEVESTVGKGTTFRVLLPVDQKGEGK